MKSSLVLAILVFVIPVLEYLYLVFVGVSQESDISDKKVTCNGVANKGYPGDYKGEYQRVLGSLTCYVGNLGWNSFNL